MQPKKTVSRKAQTVLGLVEESALGVTLPHEHIISDARQHFFSEPASEQEKRLAHLPVSLENLWWVRSHALNNLDCLQMPDEPVLTKELLAFRKSGGNTIVDVSTKPMGGNQPQALQRLARLTGLNIIMGTGFYMGLLYSPVTAALNEKQIIDGIVNDLTRGMGDTDARAGIIGEIGLTPEFRDDECRLLRACAAAQHKTGAPLTIHPPGLNKELLFKLFQILEDNGGLPNKTVICHVDIMGLNLDIIRWIADAGYFIEFDTFGNLFPPFLVGENVMIFPGEGQRISAIKTLISEGYLDQILISQDTFLKVLLTSYGGFGYGYILNNIIPAMLRMGITDSQILALMVSNPGRLLSFI